MRIKQCIVATAAVGMCLAFSSNAKEWATGEGSCYRKGLKAIGVGGSIVPFGCFVSFDYGLHDAISLGGATGFNTSIYYYYSDWIYNQIPILVRAAFHPFNLSVLADKIKIREKLDVYVGLASGWEIGFWVYRGSGIKPDDQPDRFPLFMREYIGARFFVTPNFGFMLEDCAGLGILNGGICFAF